MWQQYGEILRAELVPAFGCTEPIAIAYAAAVARQALQCLPERITACCSGNIIKNVKSVIVPNADGMKGIDTAAVLGAVAGRPEKKLEVLADVTPADIALTRRLLAERICTVKPLQGVSNLQIVLEMAAQGHTALVEIVGEHTNIVRLEKDGETVYRRDACTAGESVDYSCLSMEGILDYAQQAELEPALRELLLQQVRLNSAIAREGLTGRYGAAVGRTLADTYGGDVKNMAAARAAAGSDARMSGCEMPVVINSGSGNQGITVSMPVLEYAQATGADEDTLCRALLISNLVAIHLKRLIGRLSAFCGAVSAACGSGAAITYLTGGTRQQIFDTVVNALGSVSGIVCDGAKPSCAAKIAASVEAAILGHEMAMRGRHFQGGDGIIKDDIEATIESVARLGCDGMKETDAEILRIMTEPA